MGYYTNLSGEAEIRKAVIPDDVLNREGWSASTDSDYFLIETDGEPDDVQLIDGEITVVPGDQFQTVTLRWDDSVKAYNFDERCQALMDAVKAVGGEITGEFVGRGEENGDIWRVVFNGTTKKREEAVTRWPDGTPVR